jgi:hypothetical protein
MTRLPPRIGNLRIKKTVRRGTEGPIPEREYSQPKTPNFYTMPPIRQTDYVKHAGLSKGHVSNLVRAGMPLTSLEAADQWRGMSAKPRPGRAGMVSKPAPAPKADGEIPGPYRPPEAEGNLDRELLREGTPMGSYERMRRIEQDAYALAQKSLRESRPDAGRMVGVHAQAARNLTAAREEVLALSERERQLVSGDWVKRVMQEHDGVISQLIRAMPKQLAGRIAPHDPEHAEKELDRWVDEVFLKTLQQTSPWES